MITHLYARPEVECDLDSATVLVPLERCGDENVGDPARARHRPRLHTIHLLAGRALDERLASVVDKSFETRPVVGVATLGKTERGIILRTQTDPAVIRAKPVPRDCVESDEVMDTGSAIVVIIEG